MASVRHKWIHSLRIHGSVIPRIYLRLSGFTLLSIVTTHLTKEGSLPELPLTPFVIIGSAIGLHIAFRTNTGYERFWEARTAWGAIVNRTRNIARQAQVLLVGKDAERAIMLTIAFAHASKRHFWHEPRVPEIDALFNPEDSALLHADPGPAQRTLLELGRLLQKARVRGELDCIDQLRIEADITTLIDQFGICQRIRATPLPPAYVIQLRSALVPFLLAVPLALVADFGWLTPGLMLMLGYVFLGMEQIGTELEDPFEKTVNDVDLGTITARIEADLLAISRTL